MKLYLVRHGDAESNVGLDKLRKLTSMGIDQSKRIGCYIKDINPEIILTSPYIRAKETLKYINEEAKFPGTKIYESQDLTPFGNIENLILEIEAYNTKSLLIVGHNPLLSNLIYQLTGEDVLMGNCSFAEIDFSKRQLLRFINSGEV
jgi:phosphohistidine phosphatase